MVSADKLAVQIFGGYQGGAEPWKKTASLRVNESGFHETHIVGYSGDDRTLLDVPAVAEWLLEEFDATSLLKLLEHLARLHAALKERASLPGSG